MAAVLAGGLGTRLRPAVADRPKVLAEVAGRPFLAWLLDRLVAAGVERTVLCTGYLADQVQATFGAQHAGMQLIHSPEPRPLGTGGAVRLALPHLGPGPVLVLNGDSWCGVDLRVVGQAHVARAACATVTAVQVEDGRRYGTVDIDADDTVTAFREKDEAVGRAFINAGIYVFEREVIDSLPADQPASLERDLLPALVGRGLYAARTSAPFIDIGTPESYAAAALVVQGGAGR